MNRRVFISQDLMPDRPSAIGPKQQKIIKDDGWEIRIEEEVPGVSILDGCDSVLIMADQLVPFVLALLRVIFENKWYGEAQDREKP